MSGLRLMQAPPTTKSIIKTDKQAEAVGLMSSLAMYIMLFGGSRSGKTFIGCYAIVVRALKCADSRHCILRFRFNHCKTSIGMDTMPKVLKLLGIEGQVKLDKQDWFWTFPNGSEIWLGGLDDKERAEKILGKEYVTMYFNEASQLSYPAYKLALTRLAQKCSLALKCYLDCNPPSKKHWTYIVFIKKRDPSENTPLNKPELYTSLLMNPDDNKANIGENYIEDVLMSLSKKEQLRFLKGMFSDDNEGALWSSRIINEFRVDVPPLLKRIVVAIDPAVTNNPDSDATGIIVGGISFDDEVYILDDRTLKGSPLAWAKAGVLAMDDWEGDRAVGEVNNGGDLVEVNLRTVDKHIAYKAVRASRGKVTRAEPVAAMSEKGTLHMVGVHPELELELTDWVPDSGDPSPNRLDAMVWCVYELVGGFSKRAGVW